MKKNNLFIKVSSAFGVLLATIVTVNAQVPNISYANVPATYCKGTSITKLSPTNTGGALKGTQTVTTFAGTGVAGFANSAPNVQAKFNNPLAVAVDANGVVYVADTDNNRIRKIDAYGQVSTLAGNGLGGHADGPGANAKFHSPSGITVDASGNVFVADRDNNAVRKITPGGIVSTIAGNRGSNNIDGDTSIAALNQPCGISVDANGDVYVADRNGSRIRKISNGVVSTIVTGFTVDNNLNQYGGPAPMIYPVSIAMDANGNKYIGQDSYYLDLNQSPICKVNAANVVTTLVTTTSLNGFPGKGLALDGKGNLFLTAGALGNAIYKYNLTSTELTYFAGSKAYNQGFKDGVDTAALFNGAFGIAIDANGVMYVADAKNNVIRKIAPSPLYSISPDIAPGLYFNEGTGEISGTPNYVTPSTTYTITTQNTSGTASTTITFATITTAAPIAETSQGACSYSNATVADLVATGTDIKWYDAAIDGNLIATTTPLTGFKYYYVSQTLNNCESSKLSVAVQVIQVSTPIGATKQSFCDGATQADLVAAPGQPGPEILWYDAPTGGTYLGGANPTPLKAMTYYAEEFHYGYCNALPRLVVEVTLNPAPETPAGDNGQTQTYCIGATVASLVAIGTDIKWYDVQYGGTPLANTTLVKDATYYFATQTVNSCESTQRFYTYTQSDLGCVTGIDNNNVTSNNSIYVQGNNILINTIGAFEASVYNSNGLLINKINGNNSASIRSEAGLYIIKLTDETKNKVEKVVVE